jgi:hypothetical protein
MVTLLDFSPGLTGKFSRSFMSKAKNIFALFWDPGPDMGTVDSHL